MAQGFSDPAEAFGRGDRVEARPSLTAIDGDLDAPRTSEKDKRPRPRLRLVD